MFSRIWYWTPGRSALSISVFSNIDVSALTYRFYRYIDIVILCKSYSLVAETYYVVNPKHVRWCQQGDILWLCWRNKVHVQRLGWRFCIYCTHLSFQSWLSWYTCAQPNSLISYRAIFSISYPVSMTAGPAEHAEVSKSRSLFSLKASASIAARSSWGRVRKNAHFKEGIIRCGCKVSFRWVRVGKVILRSESPCVKALFIWRWKKKQSKAWEIVSGMRTLTKVPSC
jgi:hypothetical protein